MIKNITKTNILIAASIIILVVIGYIGFTNGPRMAREQNNAPVPNTTESPASTSTSVIQDQVAGLNLNTVFGLEKKATGTKLYYSDKLGVGFTYVPTNTSTAYTIAITEKGNKIFIYKAGSAPETGQSIEVFVKDPKSSMEDGIRAAVLKGYNASDCPPKTMKTNMSNYLSATIPYPPSDNLNDPTKNSGKCPLDYLDLSAFGTVQFFLMNTDVLGKLIFVKIGKVIISPDGTIEGGAYSYNWSHSIRILK